MSPDLDLSDDYWWLDLRLYSFCRNITEMMCVLITSYQMVHNLSCFITDDVNFDRLIKVIHCGYSFSLYN